MAEPKVSRFGHLLSKHRLRNMKLTNLITAAFLSLSLAMASCASEELLIDPSKDVLRSYKFTMFDSQNELNFSLINIKQPIARIETPFNWLDISQGDNDESGFTRIHIVRTKPTPESFNSDDAYIYLSDNKVVKISITAEAALRPSDNNDDEAFNKEWWKQTKIIYRDETHPQGVEIELPWAPARTTQIPTSLIDGVTMGERVTPDEGWTMAYNLFSSSPSSKPYFMLYNKYSGVLRVFYYQFKGVGTGGEISFAVTPGSVNTPKYPFYHSLQYGIPVCNQGIQNKNVLGILSGESPFQQLITPYLKDEVTLRPGWYCFDIDMSAYNPVLKEPFAKADVLSISLKTSNNATMTLAGTFDGNSHGTIENLRESSTSSGKGKTIVNGLKSGVGNVKNMVEAINKGETLKAIFNGGMTVYNIAKLITNDYDKETPVPEPPMIEQSFSGKISLNGYTYSSTSNDAIGVEFYYNSFAQDKTSVGQGVWSLKENPIVYVVNDLLLGDNEDISLTVNENEYLFGSQNPETENLRLFTFFDPQSIKLNLNTDKFKNIRNVKVSWVYGVYPNQTHGRTDVYRKDLLGLQIQEPIFINRSGNIGKRYISLSSDFANMDYMEYPLEEMPLTRIDSGTKAGYHRQHKASYRYYGHPGNNLSTTDENFFVVDPIVLMPCELIKQNDGDKYGQGVVYDFQAPDFVVGVMLTFDFIDDNGKTAHACYSKRFLPEVKSLSTDELIGRLSSLKNFANTVNHQTLNGSILVSHGDIKSLMNRTIKTIEYIKDNK